jgi:hypothetical protein
MRLDVSQLMASFTLKFNNDACKTAGQDFHSSVVPE